jgi:prolyl-tRNA synthetase
VAAAIEQGYDENGIIWPMALAPFQVGLVPISLADEATWQTATRLHDELEAAGVEVLLDDRDKRPGVKFKDFDLIGLPLRIVIGPKTLAQNKAEVRHRRSGETVLIDLDKLLDYVRAAISAELHA